MSLKKVLFIFILIFISIFFITSKTIVAVSDIIVDDKFRDGSNESIFTNILFNKLYEKVETRSYSYLLARTIGTEKVINWKIRNEIEAYAVPIGTAVDERF